MPDLIKEGTTGFSYKCGDIAHLRELLIYMSKNRELAKVMGKAAKEMIFSEYSLNDVTRGIEKGIRYIHGESRT
jgi:glycosyltransferase involved in cell wall biosynthesis